MELNLIYLFVPDFFLFMIHALRPRTGESERRCALRARSDRAHSAGRHHSATKSASRWRAGGNVCIGAMGLERTDWTAGGAVAHSEQVKYGVASGSAGAAVHRVHRTFSQSPVLRYFM